MQIQIFNLSKTDNCEFQAKMNLILSNSILGLIAQFLYIKVFPAQDSLTVSGYICQRKEIKTTI